MNPSSPVDPAAAGDHPHTDSTDPAARRPPSRSADPGQGSCSGCRGEGGAGQPQPEGRDDDQLARAPAERLRGFGDIDMGGMHIAVDDGVVALSGEVADAPASGTLEGRSAEVLGVSGVVNRLVVRAGRP